MRIGTAIARAVIIVKKAVNKTVITRKTINKQTVGKIEAEKRIIDRKISIKRIIMKILTMKRVLKKGRRTNVVQTILRDYPHILRQCRTPSRACLYHDCV